MPAEKVGPLLALPLNNETVDHARRSEVEVAEQTGLLAIEASVESRWLGIEDMGYGEHDAGHVEASIQ
eukprot:2637954-Alexandrium_andersonii.AAC.1